MNETKAIADIVVGQRYRQELGDIAALADSIRNVGLLHPIGITHDNELIFGERRLRAAESLGWTEIATSVIDITSITEGQYHENAMRKDFTVSERVAILETIERRRRGGNGSNQYISYSEDLPNSTLTREQAVKRAGLGNTTTAREAACIVKQGIPALVEAVDRSDIAIEPGFAIARQPPERQAEIIAMPVQARRAIVRELERPGKNTGPSKRAKARSEPARTVSRATPPAPMQWPSKEELGYPPDGSSLAEYNAYAKKYGRTPLHPIAVADLLNDRRSTTDLALAMLNLTDEHHLSADDFIDSIDRMLAWVPQPEKTNGMQTNFAADGRKTLSMLERSLPKALALLLALDAKLKERKADRGGQQAPSLLSMPV